MMPLRGKFEFVKTLLGDIGDADTLALKKRALYSLNLDIGFRGVTVLNTPAKASFVI